jgi:hypothetical protein
MLDKSVPELVGMVVLELEDMTVPELADIVALELGDTAGYQQVLEDNHRSLLEGLEVLAVLKIR